MKTSDENKMACRGMDTIPRTHMTYQDMVECEACGDCVAWDMADHPFFGFQNCEHKKPITAEAKVK